jgi:hypothetical protein
MLFDEEIEILIADAPAGPLGFAQLGALHFARREPYANRISFDLKPLGDLSGRKKYDAHLALPLKLIPEGKENLTYRFCGRVWSGEDRYHFLLYLRKGAAMLVG